MTTHPIRHRGTVLTSIVALVVIVVVAGGCDAMRGPRVHVDLRPDGDREPLSERVADDQLDRALRVVDSVAADHQFTREVQAEDGDIVRAWSRDVVVDRGSLNLWLTCTLRQPYSLRIALESLNAGQESQFGRLVRKDLTKRLRDEFGAEQVRGPADDGSSRAAERAAHTKPLDPRYARVVQLIRGEVPTQLPSLPADKQQLVASTQPRLNGRYDMGGSSGQYFFEWKFPDGARLLAAYTGLLDPAQEYKPNVRFRLESRQE
jgi:hypothetical protein